MFGSTCRPARGRLPCSRAAAPRQSRGTSPDVSHDGSARPLAAGGLPARRHIGLAREEIHREHRDGEPPEHERPEDERPKSDSTPYKKPNQRAQEARPQAAGARTAAAAAANPSPSAGIAAPRVKLQLALAVVALDGQPLQRPPPCGEIGVILPQPPPCAFHHARGLGPQPPAEIAPFAPRRPPARCHRLARTLNSLPARAPFRFPCVFFRLFREFPGLGFLRLLARPAAHAA